MQVFSDGKSFVVVLPKKEAECLGALFDACMDTVGCVEPSDIGITKRQIERAEENMYALSSRFLGEA